MSLGNSVAAVLLLLFMVLIPLVSVLNLLYFYISTVLLLLLLHIEFRFSKLKRGRDSSVGIVTKLWVGMV